MSIRLTFPKLPSGKKQSGRKSLAAATRYHQLSGNSSVKCQITRFRNCSTILPNLWDGAVLLLSYASPSFPFPIQFWGWKFGNRPKLLLADLIHMFNLSMLLNPQFLQDLKSLQNHFATAGFYLTLSIASTFKRPRPFCFVQMSCSTCSTCPTCSNTSWWSIGNNSNKI